MAFWRSVQLCVFLGLMAGFAIKVPLVPLHTWLPLAHVEAPTAGSVLAGRRPAEDRAPTASCACAVPLAPDAALSLGVPLIGTLAVIGIIYGAFCALAQDDIKKLVAYSSVSHLGFCMLGMSPEQAQGTEVGPPSDIFSLGAVLAFAATGEAPFGGGSTAALVFRVVFAPPQLDAVPGRAPPAGRAMPGQGTRPAALGRRAAERDRSHAAGGGLAARSRHQRPGGKSSAGDHCATCASACRRGAGGHRTTAPACRRARGRARGRARARGRGRGRGRGRTR